LFTVMQAKRRVLAVKEDRGEITKDEAQLEMAQLMSALKDQDQQRGNAAAAVAAQRSAASAQMLGAAAMMLQVPDIPHHRANACSSGDHDMHAHGQLRELPELLIGGRR
jgi:hypothetical protein